MKTNDLTEAAARYRQAMSDLQAAKARAFPYGTRVAVSHGRCMGPGVVTNSVYCSPDAIAVMLPNGEIWTYQLDCVEAI